MSTGSAADRGVLVTGMYRSGTTHVERLVAAHPDVFLASQPFPFLHLDAKRRFLSARGIDEPMPFGTLFGEDRYTPTELGDFLDREQFTGAEVRGLLADMRDWSGAWTPEVHDLGSALSEGTYLEIHRQVIDGLAAGFDAADAPVRGVKEIGLDELVPYVAERGHTVVLVLRDLRSVLASVRAPGGRRWTGPARPLLFDVRLWRRSVATALAMADHRNVVVVQHEHVVTDPAAALRPVWVALDLEPIRDDRLRDLRDARGQAWSPNSSFAEGPAADAPPAEAHRLDAATVAYVEATAGPELLALGYELVGDGRLDSSMLASYREPVPMEREVPRADLSWCERSVREEARRRTLLTADLDDDEARRWFVHPAAHRALRATELA